MCVHSSCSGHSINDDNDDKGKEKDCKTSVQIYVNVFQQVCCGVCGGHGVFGHRLQPLSTE